MIDRAYNWMILAIRLAARACIPALRAWVPMVNKRYHLPKSTLLLLPFKVICYEIDICLLLYTWEEPLKSICVEGIKCLSFEEQKLEAICFCGAKFVEQVPPCFT